MLQKKPTSNPQFTVTLPGGSEGVARVLFCFGVTYNITCYVRAALLPAVRKEKRYFAISVTACRHYFVKLLCYLYIHVLKIRTFK